MAELFLHVLNRALAAGWLVLAALLARLLLRRAPKYIHCLLWLLVGVRLLLPDFPVSSLSLLPSAQVVDPAVISGNRLQINTGLSVVNSTLNPYLAGHFYEGVTVPEGIMERTAGICGTLWLLGMAAMVLYALWSWWRLRRRVAEAVRTPDGLWESGEITSPFILGILRPRIYVPVHLADQELEYVAAHERSHLRRRDHWWKPLGFLLLALYWFHPLLWLGYVLLCRDIEAACDERVLRDLGPDAKRPYAQALLQCSVRGRAVAVCPLAFGETGVKARVKGILNYKKTAFWVVLVSLILCAGIAVCFLTDPRTEVPQPTEAPLPPPAENGSPEAPAGPAPKEKDGPYIGGPLLYQNPALSYFAPSEIPYADVKEHDDMLNILYTAGGLAFRGPLAQQATYTRTEFLDLIFPSDEELIPDTVVSVERRTYADEDENTFTIWELAHKSGGVWLWLGEGGEMPARLYELLDLGAILTSGLFGIHDPFSVDNTYFWTFSDLHPYTAVRFEGEFASANVTVDSGTITTVPPQGSEMEVGDGTQSLTIAPGETVYWTPETPIAACALAFQLHQADGSISSDSLQLYPQSQCQSAFGAVSCTLSLNWAGVGSYRPQINVLSFDLETGELVVTYAPVA